MEKQMNPDKRKEGVKIQEILRSSYVHGPLSRKIPFNHTSVEIKWISENTPYIHKLITQDIMSSSNETSLSFGGCIAYHNLSDCHVSSSV